MKSVNLRSFRQKVRLNKKRLRSFLTRLGNRAPRQLDQVAEEIENEVWQEVNCKTCANCCKQMTPTFKKADIDRISAHLHITPAAFKKKWLYKDENKDWINAARPCQFLDIQTNMCNIYEVRPADCAGFPHLTRKKMVDYMHVHKQNVEYCPATYRMVEKMVEAAEKGIL